MKIIIRKNDKMIKEWQWFSRAQLLHQFRRQIKPNFGFDEEGKPRYRTENLFEQGIEQTKSTHINYDIEVRIEPRSHTWKVSALTRRLSWG